jgi:para-nitrobenzyl esterase
MVSPPSKAFPYGADTGGSNRWMPHKPPEPWKGIRFALSYGACCPQGPHGYTRTGAAFIYNWDDGYPGEDMLRVNVWTKSLNGRRPVMVWIHGGGFSSGSSQELPYYDGESLAQQDVVLVSVNHRLNSLGFLDVSQIGGPAFRDSANVGMLDLVAALEWVRDNIANFGGDPENVMIFGQSGGGSKVTCLMGMPLARGLFHRAAVQSGGGGDMPDSGQSQKYAAQVMSELGLAPHDIEGLQKVEWSRLNAAATEAARKVNPPSSPNAVGIGGPSAGPRAGAGPTMDGRILPLRPFHDQAPDISKDIPMIVGSVHDEGTRLESQPTEAEWRTILANAYGTAKADALIAALKKSRPKDSIVKLSYGVGGLGMRNNVQRIATLKHSQGGAPVYQYWFTWQSPLLDGLPGAYHCSELPFCFDNTDRAEQGTGNGVAARALAKKVSAAWVAFAKTGNPSLPGQVWDPYDPDHVQTMVWDNLSRTVNDPDGALRKILLG